MRRSAALATLAALAACARRRHVDEAAAVHPGKAVRIVALGDSLALGQGASAPRDGFVFRSYLAVRARRPGSRIDSFAMGGSTAADVLRLQVPRLAGPSADAVIVCVGGNDVVRRTSPATFASTYARLAARVRTLQPHAAIVCCGVPDVGTSPLFTGFERLAVASLARVDDRAVRTAAARIGATFVDLFDATDRAQHDVDRFLSEDRFHPSDAGYRALAAVLTPALLRALDR